MTHPSSTWLTLGLALIGIHASAAISLDELAHNSPFLPHTSTGAQVTPDEATTLEFRGVITNTEGPVFGLYDRTRNRCTWVRQNEKGTEYNVVSYDASNQVVNVDYLGKKFTLALSTAKIGVAANSPVPVIPSSPTITASTGTNSTDQNRLESIAAEVRRRRVLRMAAPGATPPAPAAVSHQ